MSIYPMQLAFEGEEWLDCITEIYPLQRQGFAGYVYVPTTWVLAIVFFGITLEMRKICTNKQLNLYGVGSVVGILILTVMMQEYHIPYVSTQKLFIPCEKPEESSLEFWANDALDFSSGAQKIWSRILGRSLVPPEWHKTEL
ncbi:unnamed protein product [Oikopleura dioica]|uniref:Uncharacterized protein n=1 Tax=Oikopleura dioica TaxID=34765 RepID=E4Y890_OIKDI|nr:unnamed protein product [Oikopleura dioica]CBY34454.1 unnamed protein product [Oikopleura dioica]